MLKNRFQIELDKLQESCKQCEVQNCSQCALSYRKMEFQSALQANERMELEKKKAFARVKREQPLKAHARFI